MNFSRMVSGVKWLTVPQAQAGHSALTWYFFSDISPPSL
jgi:hypothetical protein